MFLSVRACTRLFVCLLRVFCSTNIFIARDYVTHHIMIVMCVCFCCGIRMSSEPPRKGKRTRAHILRKNPPGVLKHSIIRLRVLLVLSCSCLFLIIITSVHSTISHPFISLISLSPHCLLHTKVHESYYVFAQLIHSVFCCLPLLF